MQRWVLLTLILLLAIPAFAQGPAFQSTSLPRQVRGEGLTETVGEIFLLVTNPGSTILTGSTINIVYNGTVAATAGTLSINCQTTPGVPCVGVTATATGNQLTISFGGAVNNTFGAGGGITISQVRINADAAGAGPITATLSGVSVNPSTNPITFTNPILTVGIIVKPSAAVSFTATGAASFNILTCAGPTLSGNTNVATFRIRENYPAAFTSNADETGFTPNIAVTNGSQIQVTLTGVPAGVTVTPSIAGATTATLTVPPANITLVTTGLAGTAPAAGQVTATAGQAITWTFEPSATNTGATEDLWLTFTFTYTSGTTLPSGGVVGPVTATVSYAPVTTTSTTIVRFAANTLGTGTIGNFAECVTQLLWPFVAANIAGFDTSVAIANTTADDEALGSGATRGAAAQAGSCVLTGYPTSDVTTGAAAAATQFTTPSIASGGTWAASLAGVSAFGGRAGGFVGYVIGVCQFLDAHGFAFITDNLGVGAPRISHGYLPLIIPTAPTATRVIPGGETLGQ